MTTTTIGELVASFYDEYEAQYHDSRIASLATRDAIANLRRARRTDRNMTTWVEAKRAS